MPSPRRLAPLALLMVTAGLVGGPDRAAAAPPVTVPDDLGTTYPRNVTEVDPLANDSDPDGDTLTRCGVGTEHYQGVHVRADEYIYTVLTGPRAQPGTYTFTYEACAGAERTPGTVSITVADPPEVTIRAVRGRPGLVRVRNEADFGIRVFYGAYRTDEADGILNIRAGAAEVVRVHRHRIEILAYDRHGVFVRRERVGGIRLPGRATR